MAVQLLKQGRICYDLENARTKGVEKSRRQLIYRFFYFL